MYRYTYMYMYWPWCAAAAGTIRNASGNPNKSQHVYSCTCRAACWQQVEARRLAEGRRLSVVAPSLNDAYGASHVGWINLVEELRDLRSAVFNQTRVHRARIDELRSELGGLEEQIQALETAQSAAQNNHEEHASSV